MMLLLSSGRAFRMQSTSGIEMVPSCSFLVLPSVLRGCKNVTLPKIGVGDGAAV